MRVKITNCGAAASLVLSVLLSALVLFGWSEAGADNPPRPSPPAEVKWHKFDVGITTARNTGKHIMVDVYTDWCGWCKKLDMETYADENVRRVLAQSYISVKLKGDSGERLKVTGQPKVEGGRTLLQFVPTAEETISERDLTRRQLRITGFPTILFLNAEGQLITKLPGFHPATSFTNILNFIKDDLYEIMSYDDYLKSLESAPVRKEKS